MGSSLMSRRTLSAWVVSVGLVSSGALIATPAVADEAPAPIPGVFFSHQTVGDFDGDGKLDRAWTESQRPFEDEKDHMTCQVRFALGNGSRKDVDYKIEPTKPGTKWTKSCPALLIKANPTGGKIDSILMGQALNEDIGAYAGWWAARLDGSVKLTDIPYDRDTMPIVKDLTGDGKDEAINVNSNSIELFHVFKPVDGTYKRSTTNPGDCGWALDYETLTLDKKQSKLYVSMPALRCKKANPGLFVLQPDFTYKRVVAEQPGEQFWRPRLIDLDGDGKATDVELHVEFDDWRKPEENRRYRAASDGSLTLVTDGDAADPKPTPTPTSTPTTKPTAGPAVDARDDRVVMTHRVHEIGDIPVLRNDKHAKGAKVTIVTPPTVGTAKVLDNGRIHYDRRGKGTQTDVLTYKVTAPNGTTDTARLVITVKGS